MPGLRSSHLPLVKGRLTGIVEPRGGILASVILLYHQSRTRCFTRFDDKSSRSSSATTAVFRWV